MDATNNETIPENSDLQLLTAQQAAKILATTPKTVYVMMQAGDIPKVQFGRSVRIRKVDLQKFIEDHKK